MSLCAVRQLAVAPSMQQVANCFKAEMIALHLGFGSLKPGEPIRIGREKSTDRTACAAALYSPITAAWLSLVRPQPIPSGSLRSSKTSLRVPLVAGVSAHLDVSGTQDHPAQR